MNKLFWLRKIFSGALLLGGYGNAVGQTAPADTSLLAINRSLRQHYATALPDASALYSGPEYVNYTRPGTTGHRFLKSAEDQLATIEYGGVVYTAVPLRYDLVRDQLVLQAQGGTLEMRLVNERVARFTLGGHTFVRLAADSVAGSSIKPGFYDLLVDGPVQLLAARRKKYEQATAGSSIAGEITASTAYFIAKDGRYYAISKDGDVLRLFPQQRATLRTYLRANNLAFNTANREQSFITLMRYWATLAH